MRSFLIRAAVALTALTVAIAPAAAQKAPVVVFAAASMKTALDAIVEKWQAETGNTVKTSYGSSGTLARQLEQAAPAEVFISADLEWMDYVEKKNLLKPGTRKTLLGNALVLVTPKAEPATFAIKPGADLGAAAGESRIAVCTIASCPAGKYAKQALDSLGMWNKAEGRLAQADNVRAALALVARGEAKFGIVYATDARAEPGVVVAATFPESSHPPVLYPVAELASSSNPAAKAFLDYLDSAVARTIFEGQGFTVVGK